MTSITFDIKSDFIFIISNSSSFSLIFFASFGVVFVNFFMNFIVSESLSRYSVTSAMLKGSLFLIVILLFVHNFFSQVSSGNMKNLFLHYVLIFLKCIG